MATETSKENDKTRTRSPAYPAIGLENAIVKARQLYDAEDQRFTNLEAVAAHWETLPTNSAFQVTIAALKQFGLLIDEGSKEMRRVKLTPLAMDILIHPEGSAKQIEAIRIAALTPKIHRELWEKYSAKLPSDVSIRVYLLREREEGLFNKNHVDAFIAQFKETIIFAKMSVSDTLPPADDKNAWSTSWVKEDTEMKTKTNEQLPTREEQSSPRPPGPKMRELPVTLPSSLEIAVFRFPVPMTETDYKTLVNSLEAMKGTLVEKK